MRNKTENYKTLV